MRWNKSCPHRNKKRSFIHWESCLVWTYTFYRCVPMGVVQFFSNAIICILTFKREESDLRLQWLILLALSTMGCSTLFIVSSYSASMKSVTAMKNELRLNWSFKKEKKNYEIKRIIHHSKWSDKGWSSTVPATLNIGLPENEEQGIALWLYRNDIFKYYFFFFFAEQSLS